MDKNAPVAISGNKTMNYFWAKTTEDNRPGISVLEHMMNVGFVARAIVTGRKQQLRLFGLRPSMVSALAALHDLGKISPGFQQKCEEWLKERNLFDIARRWNWEQEMEPDHGKATHAALQQYFSENKVDEGTATFLSAVLGGHHGRLNPPDERGYKPRKAISEEQSGIDWEAERKKAADAVFSQFGARVPPISIDDSSAGLWWVGGLTSVADWIGSDESYFPSDGEMRATEVAEVAEKCLEEIGFAPPQVVGGRSFYDLFGVKPRPIQKAALSTITQPGVYVIEAPMGIGKTEAALGAAYQLLVAGKAIGIYFALPTQATSNRMHLRMKQFVERIAADSLGSKIIHSNSWLLDDKAVLSPVPTSEEKEEDAEIGRDWFSSAKRALIAPFGVGTVDQALLGVVAAKHFFVRHFALAGKVVILDEIHSYDLYTGTLIDCLIKTLEKLGCTIIVLSATLSKGRREQIVPRNIRGPAVKESYPLITGRRNGKLFKPLAVAPPKSKTIHVDFKSVARAISLAVDAATKGACVVWVCDTVDSAQQVYLQLKHQENVDFTVGLLHAHFPFWRREKLEEEWMERLGKESTTRRGSILVSTQIVEQSVDLDADLMITELAPTDMLLQRMGRLWRHDRKNRPLPKTRLYIIEEEKSITEFRKMEAKDIAKALGDKALVYNPYVLLRSLEIWKKQKKVSIPKEIRKLIEATYKMRNNEPEAWQWLFDERFATDSGKKFLADRNTNFWQIALEDDEGRQTRLNEIPTLSLVLCRSMTEDSVEFIDGSSYSLAVEKFHLATAQAIHRNFVKIPVYHFVLDTTETNPAISLHLRGKYGIAYVASNGAVSAKGLKDGVILRWDLDLGLAIEKRKA